MARESNASYESGDNRRTPITGIDTSLDGQSFSTLGEFVIATDSTEIQKCRGYSFRFKDTGGWCFAGGGWYKCLLVRYQNPANSGYDVAGTILVSLHGTDYSLAIGHISGTTSFSVSWYPLLDAYSAHIRSALAANVTALGGHFLAAANGATSLISHANGDITQQYQLQYGNTGTIYTYASADSGSTWSNTGSILHNEIINITNAGEYSTLLECIVDNKDTHAFPFSIQKQGSSTSLSDLPITATGEFNCMVTGDLNRWSVMLFQYGSLGSYIYVRNGFTTRWLTSWLSLPLTAVS